MMMMMMMMHACSADDRKNKQIGKTRKIWQKVLYVYSK
jgi:hypothetical protein